MFLCQEQHQARNLYSINHATANSVKPGLVAKDLFDSIFMPVLIILISPIFILQTGQAQIR